GLTSRRADAEQVVEAANEQAAARDGRRCPDDLPQRVARQQLELRAGTEDVDVAVFAGGIDLAAGEHRGGGEVSAQALDPDAVARAGEVARRDSAVVDPVEVFAAREHGRDVGEAALAFPGELGLAVGALEPDRDHVTVSAAVAA